MPNDAGKVVYVTAWTPYREGEVWALSEISGLRKAGLGVLIVPRSASGKIVHQTAHDLLPQTLSVPLCDFSVATGISWAFRRKRALFRTTLRWMKERSTNAYELVNNLAVLPKSLHTVRLLQKEPIVHIHAHSTTTVATLAYVLSAWLGVPWSFTLHTSVIVSQRYKRTLRALLASAAFVRACSKEVADKLVDLLGENYEEKVKLIRLGVNCSVEVCHKRQGDNNRAFVIATPAALLPHKGHQYALEACRLLLDRGISGFKWYFYGTGPMKKTIAASILKMNLRDTVEVAGFVANERLLELYQAGQVDVVVLPSTETRDGEREGIPHALMQAMAYGVPVIATDSGGTLELIGDGAGLYVPQQNASAIASGVEKLMDSADFREQQGQAGRARVLAEFNEGEVSRRLAHAFGLERLRHGA